MSDNFQKDSKTHKPEWFLERVRLAREIETLYDERGSELTKWEQGFCEGIIERFEQTSEPQFTELQEEKMREILSKY